MEQPGWDSTKTDPVLTEMSLACSDSHWLWILLWVMIATVFIAFEVMNLFSWVLEAIVFFKGDLVSLGRRVKICDKFVNEKTSIKQEVES